MTVPLVVIGAGGHARHVSDIVEACNSADLRYDLLGFVVEEGFGEIGTEVNGKPILGYFDWLHQQIANVSLVCGVGDPALRRRLVLKALDIGGRFVSLVHPSAILSRRVSLGLGTVVAGGCILTSNITLGSHVLVNLDCTVGHDSVLEDYATLAPGVHVAGNVSVGQGAFVGIGANVIERIHIGAWSVVGAGAAVIRDVPPRATAVGVPAAVIKTRTA